MNNGIIQKIEILLHYRILGINRLQSTNYYDRPTRYRIWTTYCMHMLRTTQEKTPHTAWSFARILSYTTNTFRMPVQVPTTLANDLSRIVRML